MKQLRTHILQRKPAVLAVVFALCLTTFYSSAQQGGSGRLTSPLSGEPIVVDPSRAYRTAQSPPGAAFQPVSFATASIIAQLAHSSDGVVRLAPGDYSIPVQLY